MDDEKKCCQNCKRDIPAANYEMHVIHCQRNLQLCPTCEEPVPRTEMENHKKEFHAIIACSECRQRMESAALDTHKTDLCPKRVISCQYCDLELKADDIPEHESYCGSRTEDCEECGKIFMLKFKDLHLNSNHRLTKPTDDNNSDSDNDIEDVEENFQNDNFSRHGRNFRHSHRAVPYENITRRSQGRNFNHDRELDEYFGNMGIENMRNQQPGYAFVSSANRLQEEPTYIPCEFCEVPIIAEELVLHQTGCRPDLVSHQTTTVEQTEPLPLQTGRDDIVHEISDEDDDDDIQYIEHEHDVVLIPCEFCSQQFSADTVYHHQITCGNNYDFGRGVYD